MLLTISSANLCHRYPRLVCSARRNAVAQTFERQAEHVEADTDVTDGRGCKSSD
jgi:hypothetical protein